MCSEKKPSCCNYSLHIINSAICDLDNVWFLTLTWDTTLLSLCISFKYNKSSHNTDGCFLSWNDWQWILQRPQARHCHNFVSHKKGVNSFIAGGKRELFFFYIMEHACVCVWLCNALIIAVICSHYEYEMNHFITFNGRENRGEGKKGLILEQPFSSQLFFQKWFRFAMILLLICIVKKVRWMH